jgi:NAD(P)-dependent dehydrogenase (short-subunit alcohol dehydrogenase family)
MTSRLAGKATIITGAGSGIGRASALAFAAEGARVLCADIQAGAAAETAALINASHPGQAISAGLDVTDPAKVEQMVAQAVKAFGRLDVLYSNAGIGEAGNAIDLTLEQWNRMIAVNLTSVWLCAKYALPEMIRGGGGSIINQSSTAGLIGLPSIVHYSAAKAGVIGLTRQIAIEYGPQNIRCNAICPSTIPTPLVTTVWSQKAQKAGDTSSVAEQQAAVAARHPLRRLGQLSDCANLALFLASDESSWISGVAMPLDGGLTNG